MVSGNRDIHPFSNSEIPEARNHLLVIAVDTYAHHPPLSNAVRDAKAIVNILTRRFDFEADQGIKELYDEQGTRQELYKALLEYQRTLTKEDTLLIWFGGHGTYNPDTESGYWMPADAAKGESAALEWIDFDWLLKQLTGIRAGHIAVIADSCHSGAALLGIAAGGVRKKENLPAPWILTSGRCDESVSDGLAGGYSPFTRCLLSYLEQFDEPALLFSKLEEVVLQEQFSRKQQPSCRQIAGAGDGSGQYVFRLREEMLRKTASAFSQTTTLQGIADRLRENSARYHQRLRNGRFKLLNISDLILTESSPRFFDSAVRLDRAEGVQSARLPEMLRQIWQPKIRNILLMGDGGMGKTVASVRLWEQWATDVGAPIPLFISLNEYNAVAHDEERTFLQDSLFRHYLDTRQPSDEEERALWELLERTRPDGTPAVLLMLDGLNEVTREKGWLEKEIRDFMERCQGVQVLITTRYDLRNFTFLQHFEKADLQPLKREQIEDYLKKEGKTPPPPNADEGLWNLLGNPMMLTLYAATGEWAQKCRGDDRFQFKEKAETTGELLWNFTEAQFAKLLELTPEIDPETYAERCDFFLRFLVPWIGFQMELQGQFILPEGNAQNPDFNLEKLVREGFVYFDNSDFFHAFPRFRVRNKEKALLMLREPGWEGELHRFDLVKTWLCEYLRLFVQEDEALRFAHQNFRDFFAACHLRNSAEIALVRRVIPETWKERTFPIYLRRMLGNIEGEHYVKLFFDEKTNAFNLPHHQNLVARLFDQCRGIFENGTIGLAVWNLVQVMITVRGTLAGAVLSFLDLSAINFNGLLLSSHTGNNYLNPNFKDSLLKGKQFMFHGHTAAVYSATYSPDGTKILTTAADQTIKEWSVKTGEFLRDYLGHIGPVYRAYYSLTGKEIISIAKDSVIKVWSAETAKAMPSSIYRTTNFRISDTDPKEETYISICEDRTVFKIFSKNSNECLQTLSGHNDMIWNIIYSPCGEKILSYSTDKTLKEWSIKTGKCLSMFIGHKEAVFSACYSFDGKKILSGSYDGVIKEWFVESSICLRTIEGHSSGVMSICYSPCKKKILSAGDLTVKEWSIESGECLQIITGRNEAIWSAVYDPEHRKILTASLDGVMEEWSLNFEKCVQVFVGHTNSVTSAAYNPEGNKIVSSSRDKTLKEWLVKIGKCLQTFHEHTDAVRRVVYSPDGKKILSASFDGTVKDWSVETGECLHTFHVQGREAKSAVYNQDGTRVLTATNKSIQEWLTKTGECINSFNGQSKNGWYAEYNPKGKKILSTSDSLVEEWLIKTGNHLQTITGHNGNVWIAHYSPDGKKILSASHDKTIKEWLSETGECLRTFDGHKDLVSDVTYSLDGKKVLSASYDRTIIEWSIETGECLHTFVKEIGLFVQSCDFRHLHPDSIFTEAEKKRLRRYGAIFNDEDERRWKEAVADAYGEDDNTNESTMP